MSAPILSILVVNWNTKDLLSNCLRSIYEDPDSVNWEVVVVDNDSDDDTLAMVERGFPQVVRVDCWAAAAYRNLPRHHSGSSIRDIGKPRQNPNDKGRETRRV